MKSFFTESYDFVKQHQLGTSIVIFTLILGYGFYATNYTLNLDQLVPSYYDGDVLITAGRWGAPLINLFTNCMEFSPFWQTCIMMLLLWASGLFWITLFRRASDNHLSEKALISFWAVFPVYPMIAEQLTYPNINIALAYILTPAAIWLIYPLIIRREFQQKNVIIAAVFMTISIDMYESFAPVFITGVFGVLITKYLFSRSKEMSIEDSFKAISIAAAFIAVVISLDLIISKIVCYLVSGSFSFWYKTNSTTKWGFYGSLIDAAVWLCRDLLAHYVIVGAADLSVFLFDVTMLAAIIYSIALSVKKRSFLPIMLFCGLVLSSVSLSLILCESPAYRMEQALPLFVAFMWMLLMELCNSRKTLSGLMSFASVLLILAETKTLNNYAVRNYEIFEYQYSELREIGEELEKYDTSEKHVVFIANDEAQLAPRIMRTPKATENLIVSTFRTTAFNIWDNVLSNKYFKDASFLFWGYSNTPITDTKSLIEVIKSYSIIYCPYLSGLFYNQTHLADGYVALEHIGYSVLPCTEQEYQQAKQYLVDEDNSREFSITETDDLIIVQLMSNQ